MKGAIVTLLAIIAVSVGYLAFTELQKQIAADNLAEKIIQSRVADGLRAASGPKAAVTEYYNDLGKFPTSFNQAGIQIKPATLPDHIKSVTLGTQGEIVISYSPHSLSLPPQVTQATLILIPKPEDSGGLYWSCIPDMPFGQHRDILPAACWP